MQILNIECNFKHPTSIMGNCTVNHLNRTMQTISAETFVHKNATLDNVHVINV